jgi:hypothetical protein
MIPGWLLRGNAGLHRVGKAKLYECAKSREATGLVWSCRHEPQNASLCGFRVCAVTCCAAAVIAERRSTQDVVRSHSLGGAVPWHGGGGSPGRCSLRAQRLCGE